MTEQPGTGQPSGWAAPGGAGQVQPAQPTQPIQPSGWTSPTSAQSPGSIPPPGQSSAQPPGWGVPPPPPPPGAGWGQPAWGAGPPPAPKPGIVPLRPLGFGEVLDGAFTAVQRYPKIMVGLSALLVTGLMLVSFVVMFFGFADFFTTDDIDQLGGARIITFAVTALVLGVLFWVCELALIGMITVTVSQGVLGKQVTVRQAWDAAKGRLLSLAGMMILYIVAYVVAVTVIVLLCVLLIYLTDQAGVVAVGIILTVLIAIGTILGAMYVSVRLSLTPAALVLETRPVNAGFPGGEQRPIGLFGAMRRSWNLVQGRWWRTFGLIFVAGLIAGVLSSIVQYGFLFLAMGLGLALGAITSSENLGAVVAALIYVIGGIGATILQLSFTAAIHVLIYVDARMRGEGLDLELANLTGGDAPADTVNPWAAR